MGFKKTGSFVTNVCMKCKKRGKETEYPYTAKGEKDSERHSKKYYLCSKCQEKEDAKKSLSDAVINYQKPDGYDEQRAKWVKNRALGIEQPNFKYKPKYITKKGNKFRIS